jgi:hypothetical protein
MPRKITDDDGITWSCIQAFAGLGNDPEKTDAPLALTAPTGSAWSARRGAAPHQFGSNYRTAGRRECRTATFCRKSRNSSVLTRPNRKEAR